MAHTDFPYLYPYSVEDARQRDEVSRWRESFRANIACDEGNVYAQLSRILGLSDDSGSYVKYAEGQMEFSVSDLTVEIQNNGLASGQSAGYTAVAKLELTVPVRFLGIAFPAAQMTLHTEAKYIPLF